MTADEILSRTIFTKEGFTNYELEIVIEAMKDYAKEKCREQREICFQNSKVVSYADGGLEPTETDCGIVDYHSVADAPEPTFD